MDRLEAAPQAKRHMEPLRLCLSLRRLGHLRKRASYRISKQLAPPLLAEDP